MVTLQEAKAHLRVSYDTDDDYIASLIEAAEGYVSSIGVAVAAPLPAAVRHAILLLVSFYFNNREAASERPPAPVAYGVDALLQPYREQSL